MASQLETQSAANAATDSNYVQRESFNFEIFHDDMVGEKKTDFNTWIYRWDRPVEFEIRTPRDEGLLPGKRTLKRTENEEKSCNIIVYHKAGPSKLKNCSDVDHFHMLTWHSQHLTCLHSFNILKKLLKTRRGVKPYTVSVQKVYNPHRSMRVPDSRPKQ